MKRLSAVGLSLAVLAFSSCSIKEEGPAERLGRSLDELSESVRDIGDDWESDRDRRARERYEAERRDPYYDDERRYPDTYSRDSRTPDHDPYYDTPPSDYYSREAERDEWERERARRDRYDQGRERY